jgi:hypothetical protein
MFGTMQGLVDEWKGIEKGWKGGKEDVCTRVGM